MMYAWVQCELLWERGGCLNIGITGYYRDTYAHYWTWLDDWIASSKHSLWEDFLGAVEGCYFDFEDSMRSWILADSFSASASCSVVILVRNQLSVGTLCPKTVL